MSTNLNRKMRVVFDEVTRIFCKTQQKEFNGKVVPLHLDFVTLFKMLKGKKCVLAVAAGCGGREQNPLTNNDSSSSTPHKTTTKLPSRMSKI